MDPQDIGTRYDDPADAAVLEAGTQGKLFPLLKAILLELKLLRAALTESDLETSEES